ncbi:MAG: cupin domain-containing protein [Candidatus Atribacteria bacterium]|nr:cupin domain-containing protein [Candidatus Atribacteria bacterium]
MQNESTNELFENASKLKELVAYEKGSVVSKTLINRSTGTITLFSFDEGQSLSEHAAPFDAFVYIVDGVGEISIAGKPFQLSEGDAIIIPANKPHAVKATKKFKMLLVMIKS